MKGAPEASDTGGLGGEDGAGRRPLPCIGLLTVQAGAAGTQETNRARTPAAA
jgi:hypothetical protein